MSNSPNPFDRSTLTRMIGAGAALAVLAILLFAGLWLALGSGGMEQLPRLILSLCLPPVAIAVILGIYLLVRRPRA